MEFVAVARYEVTVLGNAIQRDDTERKMQNTLNSV